MNQYTIIKKIGEGSFANVYLATDGLNGEEVAIKTSKSQFESEGYPSSFLREVSFMKELHHDSIVRLKNVIHDATSVSLVFERMGPNLFDFIQNEQREAFTLRRKFLQQILQGLAYVHACNIIHQDLSPANILLDCKKENVKISDFGLARGFCIPSDTFSGTGLTCYYMAPEQLIDSSRYSTAVDVWAVGCIHTEMLLGEPLFSQESSSSQLLCIFDTLGLPEEKTWPGVSKCLNIDSCMIRKPKGLKKTLEEKHIKVSDLELDLLMKLLCLNPSGRVRAEDALQHQYFKDILKSEKM